VTTYSGAPDEQQAVELLGESAAEQIFDLGLAALVAHPKLTSWSIPARPTDFRSCQPRPTWSSETSS